MAVGIFADVRTIPVAGGDAPCDSLPYFERVAEVSEAALERLSAKFDARIASIRAARNMPVPEGAERRYLSESGDDAADGRTWRRSGA